MCTRVPFHREEAEGHTVAEHQPLRHSIVSRNITMLIWPGTIICAQIPWRCAAGRVASSQTRCARQTIVPTRVVVPRSRAPFRRAARLPHVRTHRTRAKLPIEHLHLRRSFLPAYVCILILSLRRIRFPSSYIASQKEGR